MKKTLFMLILLSILLNQGCVSLLQDSAGFTKEKQSTTLNVVGSCLDAGAGYTLTSRQRSPTLTVGLIATIIFFDFENFNNPILFIPISPDAKWDLFPRSNLSQPDVPIGRFKGAFAP